jgi:hypothetical protein
VRFNLFHWHNAAVAPGRLAKHHYQSITTSKKEKNQGEK